MPRMKATGKQVMDPRTAYQVVHMLEGVVVRGTALTLADLKLPLFGKTGTTSGPTNVWFAGGSPDIVGALYLGYDQPRSLGAGAFGGTLCVPIFQEFMAEAVKKYGGTKFKLPPGGIVGVIGPNGAGKTTLVKMLLGQLAPTSGNLKFGTKMEVIYFDQMRDQIDDDKTVAENLAGDSDTVTVQGRSRHVISYLQDFLFDPTRARSKAKVLSGGERNRLLLARLFTKPANVLVLDEPTNDLDAETLDVLEDILVDYAGTLIMVSHDRAFLDNVVTSTLVFEGDGVVTEHAGGYTDWRNELARIAVAKRTAALGTAKPTAQAKPATVASGAKLNNKERKELETLPGRIEQLEAEQAQISVQLGDPEIYKDGGAKAAALQKRLHAAEAEHAEALGRWMELDARKDA